MDKQNFISYIKTLGIDPKIERAILHHIESKEFGDEMVEEVAQILEVAADQTEIAAEGLDKVIAEMEGLRDEIRAKGDEYEDMMIEEGGKYMDEMGKVIEEGIANLDKEGQEMPAPEIAPVTPPMNMESITVGETPGGSQTMEMPSPEQPQVTEAPAEMPQQMGDMSQTPQEIPPMPSQPAGEMTPTPQETPTETPPPAPTL